MPASLRRFMLLFLLLPGLLAAREAKEEQRIDHLIRSIEIIEGASLIRNGTEHTAKDAGGHLRLKLKRAGDRVKTAEDFIEGCASRSSLTGRAYMIRFQDGKTTETAPFFRARLREFDLKRTP